MISHVINCCFACLIIYSICKFCCSSSKTCLHWLRLFFVETEEYSNALFYCALVRLHTYWNGQILAHMSAFLFFEHLLGRKLQDGYSCDKIAPCEWLMCSYRLVTSAFCNWETNNSSTIRINVFKLWIITCLNSFVQPPQWIIFALRGQNDISIFSIQTLTAEA